MYYKGKQVDTGIEKQSSGKPRNDPCIDRHVTYETLLLHASEKGWTFP